MRLFVGAIRKLVRRPATFVTLGLLVGLLALIIIATAGQHSGRAAATAHLLLTFPGAYRLILSFILGLGGLFAMIYGAAIAGSEWNWGTLKAAVSRGESRAGYQLVSFVAVAVLIGAGIVLAYGAGIILAIGGANVAGIATSGLNDADTLRQLPELLARTWLAIVEEGALGFTIATLARSQLGGIGAGIGLYFGEQFAGIFVPDIVKYLPFNVANAVVATTAGEGPGGGVIARLDPNAALVVVAAWLLGALLVTAVFTERAEISG